MSISYKELPDYGQFIQTYFVDKEKVEFERPAEVEVETTKMGGGIILNSTQKEETPDERDRSRGYRG